MSRYIPQPAYPEKMPVDIFSMYEDGVLAFSIGDEKNPGCCCYLAK